MKSYIKIFAPFTLAILIGSLTFIFAQTTKNNFDGAKTGSQNDRRMPPPGFPPHGLDPRLLDQLNLTDAQKEQIKALQFNSRDASKANFDKVKTADDQLRTLVESGTFDETAARQILTTKAQAMIESELVRLRTDAAVMKILTAEQKTQFETLKQQRPEPSHGDFPPPAPPQN